MTIFLVSLSFFLLFLLSLFHDFHLLSIIVFIDPLCLSSYSSMCLSVSLSASLSLLVCIPLSRSLDPADHRKFAKYFLSQSPPTEFSFSLTSFFFLWSSSLWSYNKQPLGFRRNTQVLSFFCSSSMTPALPGALTSVQRLAIFMQGP